MIYQSKNGGWHSAAIAAKRDGGIAGSFETPKTKSEWLEILNRFAARPLTVDLSDPTEVIDTRTIAQPKRTPMTLIKGKLIPSDQVKPLTMEDVERKFAPRKEEE